MLCKWELILLSKPFDRDRSTRAHSRQDCSRVMGCLGEMQSGLQGSSQPGGYRWLLWPWAGGTPVLPDSIWATRRSQHESDSPRNIKDYYYYYAYWVAHFPPSSSPPWPLKPLGYCVFPPSHCHKGNQHALMSLKERLLLGQEQKSPLYHVSLGRKRRERRNKHNHKNPSQPLQTKPASRGISIRRQAASATEEMSVV